MNKKKKYIVPLASASEIRTSEAYMGWGGSATAVIEDGGDTTPDTGKF